MNTKNIEVTRGHKEYDSKVKNLDGILMKIEKVLDISKYKEEFQQIQNDVNNDSKLSSKMISTAMQMDYEGYVFANYIKRLDILTKRIEEECLPFYELYLLFSKIDIQLSEITAENIGEIIQNTKTLIELLNNLNTHNNKEKNNLIQKAYQTIYSVIMYEEIFDRNDVLSYINQLNIPTNKENIARLLSIDLQNISEKDLIEEDLKSIKTEGLGYDYLNSDFIKKVSRKTIGENNSEYQERKKQAILEISTKVAAFSEEKNKLISQLNSENKILNKIYINKALLTAKVMSMALVPIITFGAGKSIGKNLSNQIIEYKTITRTVNSETGKIVGDVESVYDENETTYVATVMAYSPWKVNPTGVGYIRNVTAYEYITPDNIEEGYHATIEDLEDNVQEKYKFVESKDILDAEDSTADSTILITETYQDKNDNRKSTKYIIPFSLTGVGVGLLIDVIFAMLSACSPEEIKRKFKYLDSQVKEHKLSTKEIKNKLINMKNDSLLLQDIYNDVVKKYGNWDDQLIISEIDTSYIMKNKNKRKI